jgi:uncharacterized DUF497 family protein
MFEWDQEKAKLNQVKHSVGFEFATRVFDDTQRITVLDHRQDYGENRYITLAKIDDRVYLVTFTLRSSKIRLISARKANTREVNRYENR